MSPKLLADLIGFLPGGGLGGLAGVFANIDLGLSDPWVLGALGGIVGASISFIMTSVEEEKTRKADQALSVAQYSYLATDGRWLCKQCPTRMEFQDPWSLLGHLKWHQDPDASMSGKSEVEAFDLANAAKTLLVRRRQREVIPRREGGKTASSTRSAARTRRRWVRAPG